MGDLTDRELARQRLARIRTRRRTDDAVVIVIAFMCSAATLGISIGSAIVGMGWF